MNVTAHLQRMNHGDHFRAYSLRDDEKAAPIDPFLGVDHAWVSAPTFPPHPHAGFSAVSYLFLDSKTGLQNRDSLGNHNVIQPGGLHWVAAGKGMVHEEVPAETGRIVHMLQIFVNLERTQQNEAPFALSLAPKDIPLVLVPGGRVRVALGSFNGARSPLNPPTEVTLLDVSLDAGAGLTVPIAAGHSAFALPIQGTLMVNGNSWLPEAAVLPIFPAQDEPQSICLQGGEAGAKVVIFSGLPLSQPVHRHGPLAMASVEALSGALAAYKRGDFGSLPAGASR